MRLFLLLLCGCLAVGARAQNFNMGVDMHTGLNEQKGKFKNAYGITLGYEHPLGQSPFYALVDLSGSLYDYQDMTQDLPGPNGHITHQRVEYVSMATLLTPGVGWAPLKGKMVSPYLAVKGGYLKNRSVMNLYDANDPDGCRPEDSKNILRDFTAVAVASGGVKIQVAPMRSLSRIDVGVNYITGGESSYLRMRKSSEPTAPTAEPYLVKFEHIATGEVHEHPLGDVYTTKTRQLQFYIKAVLSLKN